MKTRLSKIFIISICLIFSVCNFLGIFVNNVSAVSVQYPIGFEDGTLGQVYNSSYYPNFVVDSKIRTGPDGTKWGLHTVQGSAVRSGAKALSFTYKTMYGLFVWQNYSYPGGYITNYSFYVRGNVLANSIYFSFYNKTYQSYSAPLILMGLTYMTGMGVGTGGFYYDQGLGIPVYLQPSPRKILTTWYKLGFSIVDNEYADYSYNGTTVRGFLAQTQTNLSRMKIDSLYINGLGSGTEYIYIDDLNVTMSSSLDGGETPSVFCGNDMSLYNNVKQDDLINFFPSQWTGKNIEEQYMIPITTTIQGVGILITTLQYSYDSNIDNYFLNLNGFIVTADCIFEYSPGTYMVFWRTYAVLTNQKPTFAFRHEISMPGGIYWEYYINPSYSSSYLEFPKFSTSMEMFGDGVFNGNDYKYYYGELKNGLMMTFWYGEIHIENGTSPYDDMITTTKYDWIEYENVPIIWQVNSAIYPYIIQVWHNGTQIINPSYPFPYNIPTGLWSGHNSYVPIGTGNYQFRLLYNGVKTKSVNISVTHSLQNDFIMYVNPNPCEFNKEFKIGYRYYPSDGAEGLITIDPARSIVYSDAQKFFILTANTSGNLTWTGLDNYWISMYKKVGSVYYSIPAVPDIYLSITDLLNPNTLNLDYYTKTIDAGTSFTQRYYGTHGYYGQNVYITLDNVIVGQNVGYSFYYSTSSEVSTEGTHIAKLVLQTVNGTIELANRTFSVIIPPGGGGGEPTDPWDSILGREFKYVFAVGIVVMFMILPMAIASKLGVELPMIANLGSAGLGLAFCTMSGLLPLYVIFITVVAMVVGAIVIIFTR